MFALIDCKGANKIAIHVPAEGAAATLPTLIGMLERNAVFLQTGYNATEVKTPSMSIVLGDVYIEEGRYNETAISTPIQPRPEIITPDFVLEEPAVHTSYAKTIKQKDDEISRLRIELAAANQQLQDLRGRINGAAQDNG